MNKFLDWLDDHIGSIIVTYLIFIACCLVFSAWNVYQQSVRDNEFSYNCDLDKGVAVKDLDGNRRCVPTFSVMQEKST